MQFNFLLRISDPNALLCSFSFTSNFWEISVITFAWLKGFRLYCNPESWQGFYKERLRERFIFRLYKPRQHVAVPLLFIGAAGGWQRCQDHFSLLSHMCLFTLFSFNVSHFHLSRCIVLHLTTSVHPHPTLPVWRYEVYPGGVLIPFSCWHQQDTEYQCAHSDCRKCLFFWKRTESVRAGGGERETEC